MSEPRKSPVPVPGLSVKPRKKVTLDKPIMAIDREEILLEDGEILPIGELPMLIRTEPSSIVVAHHFGGLIRFLDREFDGNEQWNFRVTPVERTSWAPNRSRKSVMKDSIVSYFGFKGRRKQAGHYHYALSPHIYCLKSINELRKGVPGETATIHKLMVWAKEVREFLQKHELNLSPTSGGIAAQLLRDEKFYPVPRRKVPRHTNAVARVRLPGNYYKLYEATEGRSIHKAAYLDQSAAHHTAATYLEFPNADTLYRCGRHRSLKDLPFARVGTDKFDDFIGRYGLFYLAIETPRFFPGDFPLPECGDNDAGYRRGYFYSNEIPYLKELGVRIRHIIACWVSPTKDKGLNKYAEWAIAEIAAADPAAKPWLKPTLLSTYGVLAAKPKQLEFGFKRCKNGEPKKYPCGSGFLEVEAKRSSQLREPPVANVIQRGMIEAETRLRSLKFARELAGRGYTILAVYADSIFVDSSKPLPLIPPPWRVQDYLTALRFQSATHFTSLEISKTPGLPENFRNRAKLPPRPKRGRSKNDSNRARAASH